MYSFHQEKSNTTIPPEEIAKLLRSIGASGRLVGFNYVVYIVYNILQKPDEHYWITKVRLSRYREVFSGAASFGRTRDPDGDCFPAGIAMTILTLTALQGIELENMPTNSEFIDILVAYLRYGAYERQ